MPIRAVLSVGSRAARNVEADARLIAAAPELLEALLECELALDRVNKSMPFPVAGAGAISRARAAIAKATA
jgi:hypothetical protein